MLPLGTILEAYRLFILVLTTLNELCVVSCQWIVSPSDPPNRSYKDFFPSAITTSIGYAIAEPLAYFVLSRLPFAPVFIAGGVSLGFLQEMPLVQNLLSEMLLKESVARSNPGLADPQQIPTPSPENPSSTEQSSRPSRMHINLLLLAPTVSVAASNAAIVIFGQNFPAPPIVEDKLYFPGMVSFALLGYLMMRGAEFAIAKQTYRALVIGGGRLMHVPVQLLCLALLLGLRIGVRKLLGQEAFMGFSFVGESLVEEMSHLERYLWLENSYYIIPQWLKLAWIPMPFLVAAYMLWLGHETRKETELAYRSNEGSPTGASETQKSEEGSSPGS